MNLKDFRNYAGRGARFIAEQNLRLKIRFSSAPLLTIIKDTIRQQGPISIERYMEMALQHPNYGYYRQGNPIGTGGDFHTAPELSQLFGEMVGVWCLTVWEKLGKPVAFTLLEVGPGRGTLLCDLLRFTESVPGFHQALKINLLESNATLRALQQERLQAFAPVHIDTLDQLAPGPLIVIANEFFDNLPMRQFINTKSGWAEQLIDCKKDRLVFTESVSLTDTVLQKIIQDNMPNAKIGDVYEISEPSIRIIEKIAAHLVRHNGAALVIDYGHALPDGKTTLAGWSRHTYTDILASPGNTDVTAGVEFSALRRAAEKQGARVLDLIGQGEFLIRQGIQARARAIVQTSPEMRKKVETAVNKLTSPSEMGELWKVMVIEHFS